MMQRINGLAPALALAILWGLSCSGNNALAREVDLVAPMKDFQFIDPDLNAKAKKGYGASGDDATWNILQWSMPQGALPVFKPDSGTDKSIVVSRSAVAAIKLTRTAAGTDVLLHQDGSFLPCKSFRGEPREWDFFIGPSGKNVPPAGQIGMLHIGNDNPSLGDMEQLIESANLKVTGKIATKPKGCKVNMGASLMALYLSNPIAHQTLCYQLKTTKVCGHNSTVTLKPCNDPGQDKQGYFSRKSPYGVDDFLPLITGLAWQKNNETRHIRIDIKPRIDEALRNAPGADNDLSHWKVTGVYIGQHIWGDVELWSEWSGYRLVAVMKK